MTRAKVSPAAGHGIAVVACLFGLYAQQQFRVPGWTIFLVIPWISLALTVVSVMLFVNRLFGRALPDEAWGQLVHGAERVTGWAVRVFVAYSVLLVANGALDRMPTQEREAEITNIAWERTELEFVAYTWANLRWTSTGRTEWVILTPSDPNLWPGQSIVVDVRPGFFRVSWIARIVNDDAKQALAILKTAPTSAYAWRDLIKAYALRGRVEEGVRATLEYEKVYPGDYEWAERIALGYGMGGFHQHMYAILEPFIERQPNYELYTHVGFALTRLGRRDEGIAYLNKAIAMEPGNWWAYYHLGYAYFYAQDFAHAEPPFERVLSLRPQFPEITRDLGVIRTALALKRAREAVSGRR